MVPERARAELRRLLDGISTSMVTTIGSDGLLHARPMLLARFEETGQLVFLTHLSSTKREDIDRDARVNATFVSENGDRYVSLSGHAAVARNTSRMHQLWHPTYRAWFPNGPEDRDAAIFTMSIAYADYWKTPTSHVVRIWDALKAITTGRVIESGTRGHVRLKPDTGQSG